jgi:hypothetical protein
MSLRITKTLTPALSRSTGRGRKSLVRETNGYGDGRVVARRS